MGALVGTQASISIALASDNTVIAGVSGQSILIRKLVLFANGTNTATLWDGPSASGNVINGAGFNLTTGLQFTFDGTKQPLVLTVGNGFVIVLSATANVSGFVIWSYQKSVGAVPGGA